MTMQGAKNIAEI